MRIPAPLFLRAAMLGLLVFAVQPAAAQQLSYQVSAGTGFMDRNWAFQPHMPDKDDGGWVADTLTVEAGTTWAMATDRKLRVLLHGTAGANDFTNVQIAADWLYSLLQRGSKDVYILAGPSLNFVSGEYTFHNGYIPPYGRGDYRRVHQNFRPGLKLGAGLQFWRLSVELDLHGISMETTGSQAIKDSITGYGSMLISFRFGAR